jgi:hypothetical protein
MRKSEIIKKYKKDRHIQDNYILDEDEMYLIEEIQKALNQGQSLPIDNVIVPKGALPNNCKACGRTPKEVGEMTSVCTVSACPNY